MSKQTLRSLFTNKNLYNHAMTHKSWVNEHKVGRTSNERLEFLGDAILEYIVSKELFEKFPKKEEGYLTALRANLVNTVSLAKVARNLGLGKELLLSKGEEDGGGRDNSSLLANTVEAVIGALFLDEGLKKPEQFIFDNLLSNLDEYVSAPLKDAKSVLQERVQAKGFMAPKYEVVKEEGPDHDKNFTVEVVVDGKSWAKGEGKSKSLAEQSAAQKALSKLF